MQSLNNRVRKQVIPVMVVTPTRSLGVVLGILTGMRGLCNGLGPALFGILFYLSDVQLDSYQSAELSVTAAMKPHPLNVSAVTSSRLHFPVCVMINITTCVFIHVHICVCSV